MTASFIKSTLLTGSALALLLAGCVGGLGGTPTAILEPTPLPTSTPLPLAAVVNGEQILQSEFDAELIRYQLAQESLGYEVIPEDAVLLVLADMIDMTLLAQSALENGYVVDDAALQTRIDALVAEIGGAEVLIAWQAENGYTDEEFRAALRKQMAAAWMRNLVIDAVPPTAEQVHVRQILLYNAEEAQQVYALLQAGWDFTTLAEQYEPVTRGELGWFPRGYIIHPTIEEAAFALQPGGYSPVVESSVGFHILYLVERDPARPLSPDALLTLQEHALQDWLTQRRNASTIVIAP